MRKILSLLALLCSAPYGLPIDWSAPLRQHDVSSFFMDVSTSNGLFYVQLQDSLESLLSTRVLEALDIKTQTALESMGIRGAARANPTLAKLLGFTEDQLPTDIATLAAKLGRSYESIRHFVWADFDSVASDHRKKHPGSRPDDAISDAADRSEETAKLILGTLRAKASAAPARS